MNPVQTRFSEVLQLAKTLMKKHGVDHWKFGFNRSKRYYGICYPARKLIRLSKYFCGDLVNSIEDIRDTILHEITHALVEEKYPGMRYGHNYVWKRIAEKIGCKPVRCNNQGNMPKGKYQAFCPKCGDLPVFMHRLGSAMQLGRYMCRKCRNRIQFHKWKR